MGPILAAISAAPMMMATAAMPAPEPPLLLQHDGLHMTGRLAVGSVKHATHLFLVMATDGFVWLAGLEGGRPPGPAPVVRTGSRRGGRADPWPPCRCRWPPGRRTGTPRPAGGRPGPRSTAQQCRRGRGSAAGPGPEPRRSG